MSDLTNVKIGDQIFVPAAYRMGGALETVVRITSTQIVTKFGRYRKTDGHALGSTGFSSRFARVASPEDVLRLRIEKAQHALSLIKLTPETLDAAEALVRGCK